jgi:hypothetical protein
MSYMDQTQFAPAAGIQELSFDEIAWVGAGTSQPPKPSTGDKIRAAGKKLAKAIPGKRDDWILIGASEAVGWLVDKMLNDE